MHFFDAQTGYALLTSYTYDHYFDERANERPPYFFFTQDGGLTWEPVELVVTP